MKLFVAILLLTVVGSSFAFTDNEVCADCEYSNGLGYVPGPNCYDFYQCKQGLDYSVTYVRLCCADGLGWNQAFLACDASSYCNDSRDDCPVATTATPIACPLEAVPGDPYYFKNKHAPLAAAQACPAGTIFNETACTCVAGGNVTCSDDPLIYIPFGFHDNDIQCHKVQTTAHGNTWLDLEEGYIRLDGDGDYLSFDFLNNWFANRNIDTFTVSVWFNQTVEGFYKNGTFEGLFGNGECDQTSSIWITVGNQREQGGVRTNTDEALIEYNDDYEDLNDRDYSPPNIWCQFAIRYTRSQVTMFLNGIPKAWRNISGKLRNTKAASTIGLAFIDCIPYFWTGCLDDFMVFDRYVSDAEMDGKVWNRGRTDGSDLLRELPY